jgi:RNA polymerase sigma factor (sigma-70 family)
MATAQGSPILDYVRHLASAHLTELSDTQLLERFAARRDEAAFTVLVRRHGPLVLGVCRRVLRDWHLAQDCFQVTFLLLARKADSLGRPEALGPWLYGVATRTARKARSQAARRRLKESQVAAVEAVRDPDDREWRDLRPVLDESVHALPEKYRVPFVLHYLQGVTVTEVARRLNCPRGSIATRLSRARERLRARLVRRGLTLSAGCVLMALSESAVPASVPPPLLLSTARAAALVAAGQVAGPGLFPARTTLFTEGVVKIMRTPKVKIVAGCLLAAVLAAGAGSFAHRTKAADPERVKVQATIPAGSRREQPPRKPRVRFLSLAEARAIALENGNDSLRVLADVRPKAEGIILAGIAKDQDKAELERKVNQTLLNVETAYWNLYGSYWNLYSREQGLRFSYEAWKIVRDKYREGKATRADFAQAEGQYNLFCSQRLQAIDTLLDNERQLRTLLGIPIDRDGGPVYELFPDSAKSVEALRLVPSDAPMLVEKQPDWDKALAQSMENRPELRLARRDIKLAEENSRERRRAEEVLKDQELKTERFLGLEYRRMSSFYFQIKAARKQREAFADQLRKRIEGYRDGKKDGTLDLVLEAQRFWADALATECNAIVMYNNALCGWQYAKGSILDYAHVTLAEKTAADGKQVRAVEYEQKQTRKKLRREDAKSVELYLPDSAADEDIAREMPALAPSLPSLWKVYPPLQDVENLPPVQEPQSKK